MLSATPARQRSMLSQSRPPSSARSQATARNLEIPELPEYEPPEAPLTAESHRKIAALLHSRHLRHLQTHLQHATEKLTDTAGDVNERLVDARVRYERTKQRRRDTSDGAEEDQESDGEEHRKLDEQEHRVQAVTGRLEEKMRQMIDSEARLQSMLDSVASIEREEAEAQVAALGVRQTRAQQRRQQRANRDEDDEEDGDDERDQDYEGTPEREARERNTQNPPSRRLDESLEEGKGKWNELSLTERYVEIALKVLLRWQDSNGLYAGTLATTPTLVFTAWYTTPNSPATRYRLSHTPLHGSRIWRIQVHEGLQLAVPDRAAGHAIKGNPPPARTTLPLRESASH